MKTFRTKIYYCKSLKKTGKPIVVESCGDELTTNDVILVNISGRIKFNNSNGKGKRRGATTCLETNAIPKKFVGTNNVILDGSEERMIMCEDCGKRYEATLAGVQAMRDHRKKTHGVE